MAADQEVPRVPGSASLYRKVADDIRAAIAGGGYAAGTRLPSEHELAERYSVSRGTVRLRSRHGSKIMRAAGS